MPKGFNVLESELSKGTFMFMPQIPETSVNGKTIVDIELNFFMTSFTLLDDSVIIIESWPIYMLSTFPKMSLAIDKFSAMPA
jgi:hypothetical protein